MAFLRQMDHLLGGWLEGGGFSNSREWHACGNSH